jgi:hypothetical protein
VLDDPAAWRPLLAAPAVATAQDFNITLPVAEIESRLRDQDTFTLWTGEAPARPATARIASPCFPDDVLLVAKWATAPANASEFNNEPRFEIAAYEMQKLFLDEPELAVPPTVMRRSPSPSSGTGIP